MKTKLGVAIPTHNRVALLNALVDTVPAGVPVAISANDNTTSASSIRRQKDIIVSPVPAPLPVFENWNRAHTLLDKGCTHFVMPSDDDLFLPGGVDKLQSLAETNPDADMIVCACEIIDENGQKLTEYQPPSDEKLSGGRAFTRFMNGVDARMPGVVFKRSSLEKWGALDTSFKLTAADSELIQRISLEGTVVFSRSFVGRYRIWRGGLTHLKIASEEWISEINHWLEKIDLRIRGRGPHLAVPWQSARDEVLARNLLTAVGNLYQAKKYAELLKFLERHPVPRKTSLRTHISIQKRAIISRARQLFL